LRAHTIAAFGFLLLRATDCAIRKDPWLLYSGLALFGLSSFELLYYSGAWLSHYSIAPAFMLTVAFLVRKEDVADFRVLALMSLLYLYIYLAYPEIVPVLIFIQGGQAVFLALPARSPRLFFLALAPFAGAFLLNPLLAVERIRFLARLAGVQAGYVIFTPPGERSVGFGATILGLRFPNFALKAFENPWMEVFIVGALSVYAAAALYLAFRRRRQGWAAGVTVLLIACTATAWLSNPVKDGPGAIYKAEKAIIYGHFLLVAALVLALAEQRNRRAWHRLLAAAYLVMLLSNFRLAAEVIGRFASWPKVYPLTDVVGAVKILRKGVPVVLPEGNGISSMYWNGVLQYFGVVDRYADPLTRKLCPTAFDYYDENNRWSAVIPGQRSTIIADTVTTVDAGEIRSVARNLHQGDLRYRAEAFIVYNGPALQTVDRFSATLRVKTRELLGGRVPILTTGEQLIGSILYLTPTVPGHYRVELDVWYTAHKSSEELIAGADPVNEDVILVDGQRADRMYAVSVSVNGRKALQYEGPLAGVRAAAIFWGENAISFPEVARACEQCSVEEVRLNGKPQDESKQ
jgi:hypothetical protein